MNVHLELLLYLFSVVCRGHFMRYYDHYILAQGGIHDITAFAVAFMLYIFFPPTTPLLVQSLLMRSLNRDLVIIR